MGGLDEQVEMDAVHSSAKDERRSKSCNGSPVLPAAAYLNSKQASKGIVKTKLPSLHSDTNPDDDLSQAAAVATLRNAISAPNLYSAGFMKKNVFNLKISLL